MAHPDPRTRLLDAAEALLVDGELPSVEALCAQAGVSRATFYRRFGDKDGLAAALAAERGVQPNAAEGARRRALDAAFEVFTQEGFGASMERVAEVAGLGPATLYRHFSDKEGLIRAFVDDRSAGRALSAFAVGGKDLEADLERIAALLLGFLKNNRPLIRLALSPEASQLREAMGQRASSSRGALLRYLRAQVEAGRLSGEPERLMRSFMGLVIGHAGLSPDLMDPGPEPEVARHVARLFLEGARAR